MIEFRDLMGHILGRANQSGEGVTLKYNIHCYLLTTFIFLPRHTGEGIENLDQGHMSSTHGYLHCLMEL